MVQTQPRIEEFGSDELTELWHLYLAGGRCECHRSQLMRAYWAMVRRITQNFRRRNGVPVDLDDMVSWGSLGLVNALNDWDPGRGVRFESFAAIKIRGRIMDELRTQDWAPRNVRRRQREVDRVIEDLAIDLDRDPTPAEVALAMQTTEDDLRQRNADTESAKIRSLDEASDPLAGAYYEPEDAFISEADELESHILLVTATDHAMGGLSVHERLIIVLVYFEGLQLDDVAAITGFPEYQVSALHSEAVLKVRSRLAELLAS